MEITFEDFKKINLKIAKIKAVKKHPHTDDYVLLIDIGSTGEDKQLVANLKKSYKMEELVGKQVVYLQNTKPAVVDGIESIGLLLISSKNGKPVLLCPEKKVTIGAKVVGLSKKEVGFEEV